MTARHQHLAEKTPECDKDNHEVDTSTKSQYCVAVSSSVYQLYYRMQKQNATALHIKTGSKASGRRLNSLGLFPPGERVSFVTKLKETESHQTHLIVFFDIVGL